MSNASGTPSLAPAMQAFAPLVGTWTVTGGATGTVTYEPLEGGHFLVQRVQLEQDGQAVVGLEIIGHLRPFGEESSEHVHSRFYDNAGNTLDYVYELTEGTLWIWAGEKDSPAYFKGEMSADGSTNTGEWAYPGGGGYPSTMTRVTDGGAA